jgi:uncharacterized damage-inducible protein DinB
VAAADPAVSAGSATRGVAADSLGGIRRGGDEMKYSDAMVQEFLHESQTTKRLLERIPEDKMSWKPHEKSMPLGRLATHVTEIPQWAEAIVNQDSLDMATVDFKPVILASRREILDSHKKNLDKFAEILGGQDDEYLMASWQLKEGDKILIDIPRISAIRGFIISHVIHHRGQLSVYLRENDVPIPSIYGPSADEQS